MGECKDCKSRWRRVAAMDDIANYTVRESYIELCELHSRAADYKGALERIVEIGLHSQWCIAITSNSSLACDCHVSIATEVLAKEK